MRQLLVAVAALAMAPTFVHAADFDPNEIGLNCSSGLSIEQGDRLTLRCGGRLSLSGAKADIGLLAGESITLEARGDIALDHLRLTAPQIKLISHEGGVTLDPTVALFAQTSGPAGLPPALTIRTGTIVDMPTLYPVAGALGGLQSNISLNLESSSLASSEVLVSAVPEPATWALGLAGMGAGLIARRLRRR